MLTLAILILTLLANPELVERHQPMPTPRRVKDNPTGRSDTWLASWPYPSGFV
jgi:hypothetical protein